MGMYTEFHFNVELSKTVPDFVINLLNFMIEGDFTKQKETLKKELEDRCVWANLFNTDRWATMLRTDSGYFGADTHSTLRFDETAHKYYLCVRCNVKNYDNEIGEFIDWIMPYVDKYNDEFLGFYRYEEDREPTLIFKNEWPADA